MSYCRWSSDNFKSDLYVYESVDGGWVIHVASNRIVGDVPPIAWPLDPKDGPQFGEYVASRAEQHAFLSTAEREPIRLPGAGETFITDSPGACADKIEELHAAGFYVPDGVVAELRAEESSTPTPPTHGEEK